MSPKSHLRTLQRAGAQRWAASVDKEEAEVELNDALIETLQTFQLGGCTIGFFVAKGSEPDLSRAAFFAQERGAQIALPRMLTRPSETSEMVFLKITMAGPTFNELGLEPHAFGILEPKLALQDCVVPTILVLPCLGANLDGTRLGYGGGYYDRYLEGHEKDLKITTLLPILPWQRMTDTIPREAWDKIADQVILGKED